MPEHTIHATVAEQQECPRYHPPAAAVPEGQRWNCQSWDGLGRMEVADTGVPAPDMDHVAETVAQLRDGRRPTFEEGTVLADRVEQLEAEANAADDLAAEVDDMTQELEDFRSGQRQMMGKLIAEANFLDQQDEMVELRAEIARLNKRIETLEFERNVLKTRDVLAFGA